MFLDIMKFLFEVFWEMIMGYATIMFYGLNLYYSDIANSYNLFTFGIFEILGRYLIGGFVYLIGFFLGSLFRIPGLQSIGKFLFDPGYDDLDSLDAVGIKKFIIDTPLIQLEPIPDRLIEIDGSDVLDRLEYMVGTIGVFKYHSSFILNPLRFVINAAKILE